MRSNVASLSHSIMKSLQTLTCLNIIILSTTLVKSSVPAHYENDDLINDAHYGNDDHDLIKKKDNSDDLAEVESKLISGWQMMDKMLGCSKVPQCARYNYFSMKIKILT